jgi:peptidoglycan/LPS O-acetylase OafA/YrhL
MNTISLSQVLLLVSWFAIGLLTYILALIARFYEASSGQPTFYRLYAVPVLVLGAATARYVSVQRWGDDWLGDALTFIGGAILIVLCVQLYRQMTNRRR